MSVPYISVVPFVILGNERGTWQSFRDLHIGEFMRTLKIMRATKVGRLTPTPDPRLLPPPHTHTKFLQLKSSTSSTNFLSIEFTQCSWNCKVETSHARPQSDLIIGLSYFCNK